MAEELFNSYSLEKTSDETLGTLTIWQDTPTSPYDIGDTFRVIPDGVLFTVKKVNISDNVIGKVNEKLIRQWQVTIEGSTNSSSSGSSSSLPENEISTTYEINGTTVRTVDGEFIALRRSSTPITKKTITIYNTSDSAISTPGGKYQGGIVLSENIIKETISKNDVTISSYYKHTIEVEL